MNIIEFKIQYRQAVEQSLNQLQTLVLLLTKLEPQASALLPPQIEDRILNVGRDLQDISQSVEEFINQTREKQ